MRNHKLLLDVAQSDRSFVQADHRGSLVWYGKCIHCGKKLIVFQDGRPDRNVTVEHIVPRSAGGTDDLLNLAVSCFACNNIKGRTHDQEYMKNPKSTDIINKLLAKRAKNWRDFKH